MNRVVALILGVPMTIGLVGCSPSEEEVARNRLRNMKKPGYVRVVNLTDSDAKVKLENRDNGSAPAGDAGPFLPIGEGKRSVEAEIDGQTVKASADVRSEGAVTLYVYAKGDALQPKVVTAETRGEPSKPAVVQLVYVSEEGTPVELGTADGANLAKVGPGEVSPPAELDTSVTEVVVKKEGGAEIARLKVDAEPGAAYSVVVHGPASKPKALIVLNSPIRKPMANSDLAGG